MAAPKRKILDISADLVESLPGRCSLCCFWETGSAGAPGACPNGEGKAAWVSGCLEGGFSPGKLLQLDGVNYAYIQFAPGRFVPRLMSMPYPAPSDDAVYITCVYVEPALRGRGLGSLLLHSVAQSVYRRRVRGLETHGLSIIRSGPPGPAGFFASCGFREVTGHLEAPLMRLDLRALVPIQESIQTLLERMPLPTLGRLPAPPLEG